MDHSHIKYFLSKNMIILLNKFRFSLVPPQIHSFDFGYESVNSGDMTIVNCAVIKGDLPVEIIWTLNEKPVSVIEGINVIKTKPRVSQLSIDNVQEYHSGEYKCTANNKAKNVTHTAILNVNGIFNIFSERYNYFFTLILLFV